MKTRTGIFAIVNRLTAIDGYSLGTVVSVHPTEFAALLADQRLQRREVLGGPRTRHTPLFVLPLGVRRRKGEHVRLSDLAPGKSHIGVPVDSAAGVMQSSARWEARPIAAITLAHPRVVGARTSRGAAGKSAIQQIENLRCGAAGSLWVHRHGARR